MTVNLGLRFEHATSRDTAGGASSVDVNRVVPRLGASYDLKADGKTVLLGTYAQYSGKYNDTQFSKNTLVGNSERYTTAYTGPNGEGRDFAAGFDPASYSGAVVAATFPTLNIQFDKNLSSPLTHEFTAGAARMLGAGSYVNTNLYVFDKSDLYRAGTAAHTVFNDRDGEFTAAVDADNSSPGTLYLLQAFATDFGQVAGSGSIRISKLSGTVGAESFAALLAAAHEDATPQLLGRAGERAQGGEGARRRRDGR